MAPLAPSNTPRFKALYTQLGVQHELQIRSSASPAVVGTMYDGLFTVLTGAIASLSIDEVQFAPTGSDIFNPVTTGIEGNTYGIGGHPASDAATFWSLIGRTPGGRRVRLFFYGMGGMGADYRYAAGENATADSLVATVQAFGADVEGIDGLTPTWKTYVNAGVNAHLQRSLRP
jgi:hypothetical protein